MFIPFLPVSQVSTSQSGLCMSNGVSQIRWTSGHLPVLVSGEAFSA